MFQKSLNSKLPTYLQAASSASQKGFSSGMNQSQMVSNASSSSHHYEEEKMSYDQYVGQGAAGAYSGQPSAVPSVSKLVHLSKSKQMTPRVILWLRNDLRLHDNYVINWAIQRIQSKKSKNEKKAEILPVFCFDPRIFVGTQSQTEFGTRKTGLVRSRFELETVECLRKDLQGIGSNLIVSDEKPEEFLPKLLSQEFHNFVVYQQETCSEELQVERKVSKALNEMAEKNKNLSVQLESVWGSTLYHIDDLPYSPKEYLPQTYTQFRQKSQQTLVRDLLKSPTHGEMPFSQETTSVIENGTKFMPTLADFGFTEEECVQKADERQCYPFHGGEEFGLKRMQEYIHTNNSLGHYKKTRNGLMGSEYSSKLSPWFANGSLSIRKVYHETLINEEKYGANESTKHYIDELFWREWCRFWCMRHGTKIFHSYGIFDRRNNEWQTDLNIVQRWKDGTTGMPIIDSLMRQMTATGFMGNRGRQIVASYLTLDLQQDWRYGAHIFEEKLIDHDVQSNYGSWNFASGIGPGRVYQFNTAKQSRDFDPYGNFIKTWCPELKSVPTEFIHDPWNMPSDVEQKIGVEIGTDYPRVIPCLKYTDPQAAQKQRYQEHVSKKAQDRPATAKKQRREPQDNQQQQRNQNNRQSKNQKRYKAKNVDPPQNPIVEQKLNSLRDAFMKNMEQQNNK